MNFRRNIEIKARLADWESGRRVASAIATAHLGRWRQVDTYFFCREGRLKLREAEGRPAELIWYRRGDQHDPKASDYQLLEVADAPPAREMLSAALGVFRVIDKQREVFLCGAVRIHLDEVAGLGRFLELEAVLSAADSDDDGRRRLAGVLANFALPAAALVAGSYSDLFHGEDT